MNITKDTTSKPKCVVVPRIKAYCDAMEIGKVVDRVKLAEYIGVSDRSVSTYAARDELADYYCVDVQGWFGHPETIAWVKQHGVG